MESLVWIESLTYKSFAGIFTTAQRGNYIYTLLKQGYFSPLHVHAVNGYLKNWEWMDYGLWKSMFRDVKWFHKANN